MNRVNANTRNCRAERKKSKAEKEQRKINVVNGVNNYQRKVDGELEEENVKGGKRSTKGQGRLKNMRNPKKSRDERKE